MKKGSLKGQKDIQEIEAARLHDIMKMHCMRERRRVAIDGGAHVGSWTVLMAGYFDHVVAFEPCRESFEMLCHNVGSLPGPVSVEVHQKALMDAEGKVNVHPPKPSRQTLTARQVTQSKDGGVEAVTIDSFNHTDVDLIKLDLEGAELLALIGAMDTIKRCHPFLVIEFNNLFDRFGYKEVDMLLMLRDLRYKQVWAKGVDRGFVYEG